MKPRGWKVIRYDWFASSKSSGQPERFAPHFLTSTFGIGEGLAYRLVISLALLQFALVIPALLVIEDVPVRNPRINWRRELIVKILKFSLPSALIGLGAGITIPYMSLYFNLRFGQTLAAISGVFFFQQLVMGIGSFALPRLVDRIGPVNVITLFQLTAALLFASFPMVGVFLLAAILYIARSILMNIVWPINDSFMMGFFTTEEKATAAGIRRAFSTFMRGLADLLPFAREICGPITYSRCRFRFSPQARSRARYPSPKRDWGYGSEATLRVLTAQWRFLKGGLTASTTPHWSGNMKPLISSGRLTVASSRSCYAGKT